MSDEPTDVRQAITEGRTALGIEEATVLEFERLHLLHPYYQTHRTYVVHGRPYSRGDTGSGAGVSCTSASGAWSTRVRMRGLGTPAWSARN